MEEVVSARQERVEVFMWLEVEALETPQLIEQTAPDNQDVFVRRVHRKLTRAVILSEAKKLRSFVRFLPKQ